MYYIGKKSITRFWDLFFVLNIALLTRMTQNSTTNITTKMMLNINFKKVKYNYFLMVIYIHLFKKLKLFLAYNIGFRVYIVS